MIVNFFMNAGANQFVSIFCIGGALRSVESRSRGAGARVGRE